MKKGILLSVFAIVLIGAIIFSMWYINEDGKMRTGNKDSFIPYNSAVVINVNSPARLSAAVGEAFAPGLEAFRRKMLFRVTDTLRACGYAKSYPYALAARVQGKSDVSLLYVMDNKDVLSRGEIAGFLNQLFPGEEKERKYDRYKIYTLQQGEEKVYFAVCGGIVLISDSDLYIEDGLKQFDLEESGETSKPRLQNLDKYFSAGAGINIFLNTSMFTDLLPLYIQIQKIFPHVDISRFFKWGAFDGELNEQGFCLNGFWDYSGQESSYIRTLQEQQPRESGLDAVVPSRLASLGMLNLSNPAAYFTALDAYRYTTGKKDDIRIRKQQYAKMFGSGCEEEMNNLLQGEFALVTQAYNAATEETDGLVIVALKSGGLCRILFEKMLKNYARFDDKVMGDYRKEYSIDREKAFAYYRFPAEDLAAVYWGYIFESIKCRYVLVEDNYLILASSETAVKDFITDYVHGSFIRDAEWYRNLKTKLAKKYNLSYFARTADMLPFYQTLVTEGRQTDIKAAELSVFPTLAWQWSNEGGMLYNTLYLSASGATDDVRPHLLWQTKVEARVSMKPIPVTNHDTGERELLVQDDNNTLYLINDAGRILWKLPLDARVNSEIYQVDMFKNGKLQYLFSTPSKMYLIDRNGNAAGRFPVAFKSPCEQGISMYDYDNNRNYRIFAPCADREIYLYGVDGNLVQGWDCLKADKPMTTKVLHFRVADKDYIIFADSYRLYILDRKGQERVRVASVFDLKEQTDIFLTRKQGVPVLAFAGAGGSVSLVDFSGKVETFNAGDFSDQYRMNIADMDGDGTDDCIFTDGNRLAVCSLGGQSVFDKKLEATGLDFPYIYRFSASDVRIGLADREQNRMLLLSADAAVSKGFPISGDSPFSIVFSGNDGFFLFAGADNGTVIKYKVQR